MLLIKVELVKVPLTPDQETIFALEMHILPFKLQSVKVPLEPTQLMIFPSFIVLLIKLELVKLPLAAFLLQ